MAKKNCWEFKQCGREHDCPAATMEAADGFLGGKNGGRGCMYITGTFCSGQVQGTAKEKEKKCFMCGFYHAMDKEENANGINAMFSSSAFMMHCDRNLKKMMDK